MYPIHQFCQMLPEMSEEEFVVLRKSIREEGLLEPGYVYKGVLIDGRHRQKACEAVGVPFRVVEWEPVGEEVESEIAAFVMKKNLARRHLTTSQRALVAGLLATAKRGKAVVNKQTVMGGKPPITEQNANIVNKQTVMGGKPPITEQVITNKQAAEAMGVSIDSVKQAKAVLTHGAKELQESVKAGDISVSEAAVISKAPIEEQIEAIVAKKNGRAKSVEKEEKMNRKVVKTNDRVAKPVGKPVMGIAGELNKMENKEKVLQLFRDGEVTISVSENSVRVGASSREDALLVFEFLESLGKE